MRTEKIHLTLLTLLTVVSVIFFHSRYLINWDAGQFALGTIHYSLSEHTPHPPGYYLFVQSGKLLTLLTHDVNASFILLASLAALAALLFFYRTVLLVTGKASFAFLASLFLLTHPIFWYARSVALTYSFEALASALSLWATAEVLMKQSTRAFWFTWASLSLLAGFRPSIILASLPLLAIQTWHLRKNRKTLTFGIIAGTFVSCLWFVPFVYTVGGLGATLDAIGLQAGMVHGAELFDITSQTLFLQTLLISFNVLLLIPLFRLRTLCATLSMPVFRAILVSVVPPILFYLFFHFGEVGYILAITPALLLLISPSLLSLFQSRLGKTVLGGLITLQLLLTFFPPEWIDNRKINEATMLAVGRHDRRIQTYLSAVRIHTPSEVVVVILRGQYFDPQKTIRRYPSEDIRLLSYYLPEYTLIDFLGTPGFYTTAQNFQKTEHSTQIVPFAHSARTLLVFADFVHPDAYPTGVSFINPSTRSHANTMYRASLEDVSSFEFLGFRFERQ